MKKNITVIAVISFITVLFLNGTMSAQDLEPGDVLPPLTEEQKLERFAGNFFATVFGFMAHGKEHGKSIEDVGRFLGEFAAVGWPDEFSPEFYINALNNNLGMFDVTIEVLEVGEDYITARRTKIDMGEGVDEAFQGVYGYSISDFEKFFTGAEKGILSSRGMTISYEVEDAFIVFTVSQ